MKCPAVRAALAAKDAARRVWKSASRRRPKREAKRAYKEACRTARDLQRTADRRYEREQVQRLIALRKQKHLTPELQIEREQILNYLKNKNPVVMKPMPGVVPVPDPDALQPPAETDGLTANERESAEASRNHLRKLGKLPPMAPEDPKAALAHELHIVLEHQGIEIRHGGHRGCLRARG